MSPSDASVADAATVIERLERLANGEEIAAADLQALVSAVTRLYAAASSRAGHELPPLNPDVSTTEALTLACALLRSQDLTPFDMAMWFSRGPQQR